MASDKQRAYHQRRSADAAKRKADKKAAALAAQSPEDNRLIRLAREFGGDITSAQLQRDPPPKVSDAARPSARRVQLQRRGRPLHPPRRAGARVNHDPRMAVHRYRGYYLFRNGAIRRLKGVVWVDCGNAEDRDSMLPALVAIEMRHAWASWKTVAI